MPLFARLQNRCEPKFLSFIVMTNLSALALSFLAALTAAVMLPKLTGVMALRTSDSSGSSMTVETLSSLEGSGAVPLQVIQGCS